MDKKRIKVKISFKNFLDLLVIIITDNLNEKINYFTSNETSVGTEVNISVVFVFNSIHLSWCPINDISSNSKAYIIGWNKPVNLKNFQIIQRIPIWIK
ncbi:hypothetical protein BpHYR1_033345 [Brachionus plicatilis]|uniref:Uncharacterized protein n=1 Tax=Brachionus plicatilis TaxID=10195 RepID=A0A3M7PDY8_BRAPC|nr:hypothetical protein BpHYR1_033345 [Brachionus plicatilis]